MKTLIGKKIGMTQVFTNDALLPVTLIEVGPCVVTQIKDEVKDGYRAVQIGFSEVKDKHLTKPLKGHFAKAKVKPSRYLAEYRINKEEEVPQVGSTLSCNIFEAGEVANVSAVSKGKGFQGVIRRWGFAGGPGGHGSHFHRSPGSIGMAATPSRVFKGMKMAGRMGGEQVTIKNLEILKVDDNQNVIIVKGAVPGGKGALVLIKATGKTVKPVQLQISDTRNQTLEKDKKEKEEIKEEVKQEANTEEQKKQSADKEKQQVEKQKVDEQKTEKTESKAEEQQLTQEVKEQATEDVKNQKQKSDVKEQKPEDKQQAVEKKEKKQNENKESENKQAQSKEAKE